MYKIPLCKTSIGLEEVEAVISVLKSGQLAHSKVVEEFECQFAEFIGSKYAIAMNSCTSAIQLALMSNDIKGDVLIPSFTFSATANAVVNAGCNPVFVEIGEDKNIDPDLLCNYLTINTKALIVVHFAGQVADMEKIKAFCEREEILLIEDCAQCIGGYQEINGSKIKAGNFGIGCFSFFPTKNMTTGEGGMLTTNNPVVAKIARLLTAHGIFKDRHYRNAVLPGFNYRMSSINAAIGLQQLKKLDDFNAKRIEISKIYNSLLSEFNIPKIYLNRNNVYQMYNVVLPDNLDRDNIVKFMQKEGIEASVHFDPPVHKQHAYLDNSCSLSKTEKLASKIVTLPIFPDLNSWEVDFVSQTFKKACFSNGTCFT